MSVRHRLLSLQTIHAYDWTLRLIGDTEDCDYLLDVRLGYELGKNSDVFERALSIS
jgi:hypothetical protein